MASTDRQSGKVKMINQERGFGFIRRDGAADLFFHVTECGSKAMFAALGVGSYVRYSIGKGKRGDEGRDIEAILDDEIA